MVDVAVSAFSDAAAALALDTTLGRNVGAEVRLRGVTLSVPADARAAATTLDRSVAELRFPGVAGAAPIAAELGEAEVLDK